MRQARSSAGLTDHSHLLACASAASDPLFAALGDREVHHVTNDGRVFTAWHGHGDAVRACFHIAKRNMERMYNKAGWGWDDASKFAEMSAPESRFLLISMEKGLRPRPVGFASYWFDLEDGVPVLYLYELQFSRSVQGVGLGSWCMDLVERIARHFSMRKVMLTVFTCNKQAVQFYKAKGYSKDVTSPDYQQPDVRAGYHILSKQMPGPSSTSDRTSKQQQQEQRGGRHSQPNSSTGVSHAGATQEGRKDRRTQQQTSEAGAEGMKEPGEGVADEASVRMQGARQRAVQLQLATGSPKRVWSAKRCGGPGAGSAAARKRSRGAVEQRMPRAKRCRRGP